MFPEFPFFFTPVTGHVIYKAIEAFKGQTSQMDFGKENCFLKTVFQKTVSMFWNILAVWCED